MAKKQTPIERAAAAAARAAVKAQNEDQIAVEIEEESDLEQEDALASLATLGADSDYRFIVNRLAPLDRKGRIEDVSREELAELPNYLRDKYGAGKYEIITQDPDGRYVKRGRRTIIISPDAVRASPGAPPAAGSTSSPASDFERWRAEEERRYEARRLEAREDRKFMLTLFAPLIPQLFQRESVGSMVQALVALKGVNGAGEGGASSDKLVETLFKGLELGKDLQGGNADSWPAVIRETLKDLSSSPLGQTVMDRIANRDARRPPALPAPGAAAAIPRIPYPGAAAAASPEPPSGSPALAGAPDTFGDPMLQLALPTLQKLADELLEFAANGADPGLAAEALVAKVPRQLRAFAQPEKIRGWLADANWWPVLRDFKPALEPYQGYCDDVRQSLLTLYAEAQTPNPEST